MTTITLDEAYNTVAVFKETIAIAGSNGISIINYQGEQEHLHNSETQNLS